MIDENRIKARLEDYFKEVDRLAVRRKIVDQRFFKNFMRGWISEMLLREFGLNFHSDLVAKHFVNNNDDYLDELYAFIAL